MGLSIDLNADMGESFGAWTMGDDAALMPWITSANVACGWHAGDPSTIAATTALAVRHGVAIGAHPGLPDLQGFGRRTMQVSEREVHDLVLYQAGADPYREDPYSPLDLDHDDLRERDRLVFAWARKQGLPIAWVLAGGYTPDVSKVVDVHVGTFDAAQSAYR